MPPIVELKAERAAAFGKQESPVLHRLVEALSARGLADANDATANKVANVVEENIEGKFLLKSLKLDERSKRG